MVANRRVVSLERRDNVAIVTIDHPPVNLLSRCVRQGLLDAFAAVGADPYVDAAVLHCTGVTFVSGLDLSEFGPHEAIDPDPNDVVTAIENLDKPVVAAIHGNALGGGYELALGCHYRIALPSAQVGLTQVGQGLVPGAGGTQRLPRLVGIVDALEIVVSGVPVAARRALDTGMLDAVVDGELVTWAIAYAKRLVADRSPVRRAGALPIDAASAPPDIFSQYRSRVGRHAPQVVAKFKAIDCIEAATRRPFADGLAFERECLLECLSPLRAAVLRQLLINQLDHDKPRS